MTLFKRGTVYLNCLMCGNREFTIVRHLHTRTKALKCKRCGFMFKESSYFDPILKSTPEFTDELSPLAVKKE